MRYRDDFGFLTRDPAGMIDGPNEYTYVNQNPWTMFDPEGLAPAATMQDVQAMQQSEQQTPQTPPPAKTETLDDVYNKLWPSNNQSASNQPPAKQPDPVVQAGAGLIHELAQIGDGIKSADPAQIAVSYLHASTFVLGGGELKGAVALEDAVKFSQEAKVLTRSGEDVGTVTAQRTCANGFTCFTAGTLVATPDCNGNSEEHIEDIHVGDRVLSADPKDQQSTTNVEPRTWKVVTLDMDVNGDHVDMQVLRSPDWVENHKAQKGAKIWFEWKEIDLQGWAEVDDVEPIKKLGSGNGRVVTATIKHTNANVYKLSLSHGEPIEVTGIHLIYSESRHEWIHASDLKIGEKLRSRDDQFNLTVIDLQKESGSKQVYNLEVEGDHHFYVGSERLLVHNTDYTTLAAKDALSDIAEDEPVMAEVRNEAKGLGSQPMDLDAGPSGSYTHLFQKGDDFFFYHGKGDINRALASNAEQVAKDPDLVPIMTQFTPQATVGDALMDEALRIRASGGIGAPGLLNQINSHGEKLLQAAGK